MTEVSLAEHNNVVKALPSDRTDQPFGISVLPWGVRRCRPVTNAHRSKSSDEDLTIGPVPVTDQVAGSLFPTACFRDLICDPFCSGVSCDAKPQNLSSAVPHDQRSIEQAKRDRRQDEQIHRRDAVGMVMKKRLPALRRWPSSLHHILRHARLADIDAELKQSPWIRGAPHSGLAMLISRISLRISVGKVGRVFRAIRFISPEQEPPNRIAYEQS